MTECGVEKEREVREVYITLAIQWALREDRSHAFSRPILAQTRMELSLSRAHRGGRG